MTASIKDDLRSFRRSWVHHTGMQLATFTVLTATFTVVAFVLSLSLNLNRLLASWGDTVTLTAYLKEEVTNDRLDALQAEIQKINVVSKIEHTPREVATERFKAQMASYAPGLLEDSDFANPFPASLRISLVGGVRTEEDVKTLETLAKQIGALGGVEDVSYGQSWVQNYSGFVAGLTTSGSVMMFIMLIGGLFVVGNSIRASIGARREEIEILELIGATASMIRRPYVAEGAFMGFLASLAALGICFGLHLWQTSLLASNVALARIVGEISFLGAFITIGFALGGATLGAFGAWLTIRKLNDGWSASQRTAA